MFGTTIGDEVVRIAGELPEGIFASCTSTSENLILKLVNVNNFPLDVDLTLSGISAGKADMVFLQSDDLTIVNSLEFKGDPIYRTVPKTQDADVIAGKLDMTLEKYSFYVIIKPIR